VLRPSCRRVSATSYTPYDHPSIQSEWAAIKPETVLGNVEARFTGYVAFLGAAAGD